MFGSLVKKILDEIAKGNGGNAQDGSNTTTGAPAQVDEEFVPDVGPLAVAFGPHLVQGILGYKEYQAGPPPSLKFAILNGDGLGVGWEGPEKVWWAGRELALSPDGVTPGYHFHPGTYTKVDFTDDGGPQGRDSFFPTVGTFSGTSWTAVRLPEVLSTEDRPTKLRQHLKCMKLPNYNSNGGKLNVGTADEYTYSTDPSRVIMFGAERSGNLGRINWRSLIRFQDYCNGVLSWNNGTETLNIPRFQACPVWTKAVPFNELLDVVALVTGMTWQNDGGTINFLLPTDLDPVHEFTPKNIIGNITRPRVSVRKRMNRLVINFRNIHDIYLRPATVIIERPGLIAEYGEIRSTVSLPNMSYSQAQRIGEMIMRLATDYPGQASFEAAGGAFRLLEGDCAVVTHPALGWTNQLVRVTTVDDSSNKSRPDVRRFDVQALNGPIYKDTDHKPIQQEAEEM